MYKRQKNEEGKSELLVAENFAMNPDNLKKSDYIAYMESVCRLSLIHIYEESSFP